MPKGFCVGAFFRYGLLISVMNLFVLQPKLPSSMSVGHAWRVYAPPFPQRPQMTYSLALATAGCFAGMVKAPVRRLCIYLHRALEPLAGCLG